MHITSLTLYPNMFCSGSFLVQLLASETSGLNNESQRYMLFVCIYIVREASLMAQALREVGRIKCQQFLKCCNH